MFLCIVNFKLSLVSSHFSNRCCIGCCLDMDEASVAKFRGPYLMASWAPAWTEWEVLFTETLLDDEGPGTSRSDGVSESLLDDDYQQQMWDTLLIIAALTVANLTHHDCCWKGPMLVAARYDGNFDEYLRPAARQNVLFGWPKHCVLHAGRL